MIDRRTIALINGEVDGENTPEESEILRQIVARDAEARNLLEDLKKLERNIASISAVPPPAGLKKSIMVSVQERRVPARIRVRRFSLSDFLFPGRPLPRLGFAFGGGVVAGILLVILYLAVANHPSIDAWDASGALFDLPSESFQTVERAVISVQGAEGSIATEFSGPASVLRVNLTLKPGLTARFLFDSGGAKLKGVSLGDEFTGTLTQSDGLVEVSRGGGAFRVFFAANASSKQNVRFQVVSEGQLLYDQAFPLRKGS
jgi:hypothetical protein